MRIALVAPIRSKVGGTEAYVDLVAGALSDAGHALALWHELDGPASRGLISPPGAAPVWSAEAMGHERSVDALRDWAPDVIFSHGVSTPIVEAAILDIAPTVMFAHAYHGACISGSKSRLSPLRSPCSRPLGSPCLLHYFPRRCGGLNPLTMARLYRLETGRRDMLHRYDAILTASTHMRREYLRYDLPESRVHVVGLLIDQEKTARHGADGLRAGHASGEAAAALPLSSAEPEWRLLFVARLTNLKGGDRLLHALPALRKDFTGKIILTVAGDGPERASLERTAQRIVHSDPGIEIRFVGWLGSRDLTACFTETDLLVMPSVWPEPFGLAGPEAGLLGVPAAAFAVGGIPDWLTDGVNGHLAPGDPPTSEGLAIAISRSLLDRAHHARLREGAITSAKRLGAEHHLPRIISILAAAATSRAGTSTR